MNWGVDHRLAGGQQGLGQGEAEAAGALDPEAALGSQLPGPAQEGGVARRVVGEAAAGHLPPQTVRGRRSISPG